MKWKIKLCVKLDLAPSRSFDVKGYLEVDRPVWEKSWVLERLQNCFWGRCCRPDGKAGGRGSTCNCSFSPLVFHGLWISARTLIVLKSEEWRQQDGGMDEAQLSLVILKVEERVVFWSLVWMSAGFATELLRGSLLVWIRKIPMICGLRLMESRYKRKVRHL